MESTASPLIRESNKCIKCMRCIQICDKVQDLRVWDVQKTGSRTTVNVSLNRSIEEAECSLCGQCITHCPVQRLACAGRRRTRDRRVQRSGSDHHRADRTGCSRGLGRIAGPAARNGDRRQAGRRACAGWVLIMFSTPIWRGSDRYGGGQ